MDGDIKRSRKRPIEAEDNGKSFPKKHKYEGQAISKLDTPTEESDALNALTEAPSSDAPSTDAPVKDALVEAPNSDALVEAPSSDALVGAPSSDALVELPNSDTLVEAPSSDTLVEAPSSDALLALLGEAPDSDPLLDETPSSEESNEPWNNDTMLTPIDYQYYDALAQTTSSNGSDDASSSDAVPAPVENRYDYDDWIAEAPGDAAGDPAEAPGGDDEEGDDEEDNAEEDNDEEDNDEEDNDEEGDDMSSEVEDEGQNSSNESKAARSYDSFGNSIEDSFNSDEPEDEPEGSPTLSEYEARAREASEAERYYDLARDDPSSSEPSSSGNSGPTYY